jgi:hypothetical protein
VGKIVSITIKIEEMEIMKTTMKTLSTEVNRLQKAGYDSEIIHDELKNLDPQKWKIDEICRFEGMSDPADNAVIYALSTTDGKRRSLIINSFGFDNGEDFALFIKNVPEAPDISHS